MSQSNSSSYNDVVIAGQKLSAPVGSQLTSSANRTLVPSTGAVAYDESTQLLYFGTTTQWVVAGTTGSTGPTGMDGILSIGNFDTTSTPNAATLNTLTHTLTMHAADASNPGSVDTIAQSFAGVKTFNNGVIVQTPVSLGVNNLVDILCNYSMRNFVFTGPGVSITTDIVLTRTMYHFVNIGLGHSTAGTLTGNGLLLSTLPVPVEFRPTTPLRNGYINMVIDGVNTICYLQVDPSGIIAIGSGLSAAGFLTSFLLGESLGINDTNTTYTYD